MDAEQTCPSCHRPLPANVRELCPECLMQAGFATGNAPAPGDPSRPHGFVPPTVAEVARLFPQFEVLELLGHGGMGAVYRARQPSLDRWVALKILPPAATGAAGFAERFAREAKALARLNHPNIVTVYDFGRTGDLHYVVMEYVEGGNLRQLEQTARFSAREALRIVVQICEALQFAHDEGIVHRDIKPENVMLDKKGRVKITDFGLAKILGREAAERRLTGAEDVMGTPHYMAPEQIEHPQEVDHRADIYSLGVVFYELLTGELPLGRFAPPSRKVQVDVRLDQVVLHALEKEPERRYQHADEVKGDVESIAVSSSAGAPATRVPGKTAVMRGAGELPGAVKCARWSARVLGTLLAAFFALFVLMEGLPPIGAQPGGVQLGFVSLGLTLAGMIVGWRREGMAALLIASGWTLWTIIESRMRWNLFQTPLPVAALYAYCWWATRGRQTRVVITAVLSLGAVLAFGRLFCPANVFVRGAVIDAKTRAPVRYAELAYPDERSGQAGGHPLARSDKDGRFTLYVGWYAAGKPLEISAPGYVTLRTNLAPRPLGRRELTSEFTLTPELAALDLPDPVSTPVALPPVVISTDPESGSALVDPGLREIRITFSKPMNPQGVACTSLSEGTFPKIVGEAGYARDGRTLVIPVRLQPGKVYGLWVNGEGSAQFQSREGFPAVSYLLIFQTRRNL